jgi:glycosyltransferase involved in cell wall biosynthesis
MITVVFATHNGASTLPATLEAFAALEPPEGGLRFIGVDNASTDDSLAILRGWSGRLPLTVLSEPEPGKVPAIERGLRAARRGGEGGLIVFTDDDVVPDPGWLGAYERAAAAHPGASVFAGQVRHVWEVAPPPWLERLAEMGLAYAGTDVGLGDEDIHWSVVKGLNFAVRPGLLDICRFRDGIWVAGSPIHGGEETTFARDAVEAGHRIRFVPRARVGHMVRANQIGARWLIKRYFRIGQSLTVTAPDLDLARPAWRIRAEMAHRAASGTARAAVWLCLGRRHRAMRSAIFGALEVGRLHRWRLMTRG